MRKLLTREYFLLLLPVFFVLHGYAENYPAVPAAGAALLLTKYLIAIAATSTILYFILKDFRKAAIITFCIFSVQFFFGAVHDWLKWNIFFISKYVILIPIILAALITCFIMVKRSRFAWNKQVQFINLLLLILCIVDVAVLFNKSGTNTISADVKQQPVCDTCKRPDIYLIIADEYAGSKALAEQFHFDNSAFENELSRRSFHVLRDSRSNYNFTPYSVASMLQMNYLQHATGTATNKQGLQAAYTLINENETLQLLRKQGYRISNLSYFTFDNQPAITEQSALVNKEGLISGQTFTSRLWRDLGHHLVYTFQLTGITEKVTYTDYRNNHKIIQALQEVLTTPAHQPRFVYTHLMMPHYPYYQKSNGEFNPLDSITEGQQNNMRLYLEYLQYTNGVLLSLIDQIKKAAPGAVIILISDHGYREYPAGVPGAYHFMNLHAVHGISTDSTFYPQMSNVNAFRIIFNKLFKSNYPVLKDSTIFLKEF